MELNESAQLRSVEESLVRRFGDRLSRAEILDEIDRARQTLSDARVLTFVPVLVEHQVAETLRQRVWF